MMYKLLSGPLGESIKHLETGRVFGATPGNVDYEDYLAWVALGNTPEGADAPGPPSENVLAQSGARAWFGSHQAAVNFVRLTPAEQESQIDGYTLAQLKELVKFLAVAVSMLIKRELL